MLQYVFILTAVIAGAWGAAVPEGLLPQLDGRIVGGYETSIEAHPYQVSLQRNGQHSCGGSIYSQNIVVTAAHCLQKVSASQLRVRVGSSNWNSGGSLHNVAGFINHSGYDSRTMVNDIAVIRISSSFSYRSSVKALSLAAVNPANGASAVVSGWGVEYQGGQRLPTRLRAVNLQILDRARCSSQQYKYGSEIRSGMICATAVNKDSCQGDSGGPLVSGNKLVGVVSWGRGCADSRYPGIYSDVAYFRSWIEQAARRV